MNTGSAHSHPALPGDSFAPTRWTVVLRARAGSDEGRAALSELCAAYYQPVLAFIRREGRDEDAARELTQEFFAGLLAQPHLGRVEPAKGRFRSYLLGAVKHFLAEERQRRSAAKRGGGQVPVSMDHATGTGTATELQLPDYAAAVPDAYFDQQWATALVNRSAATLGKEAEAEGKGDQFAMLKPWLIGEVPALSQADAARALSTSEGAVKVAIHRLRRRFRVLVKAEIAQTVGTGEDVAAELRYLVEVLAQTL
jgi:DNA-directed RNA polymerase specialized sigma24 family protein